MTMKRTTSRWYVMRYLGELALSLRLFGRRLIVQTTTRGRYLRITNIFFAIQKSLAVLGFVKNKMNLFSMHIDSLTLSRTGRIEIDC